MSPKANHFVDQDLLTRVPIAQPDSRVREVVGHLTDKKHGFESIGYIYVLEEKKLVGTLSIKELLKSHADQKLSEIMTHKLVIIHPHTTFERAAITAIQHGIKAVPVVDKNGIFMGVVGTDSILHTLHREHAEDLLKIGGIQIVEQKHILELLSDRLTHLIRIRFGWLFLGLLGGFVAALVVGSFEDTLREYVTLAFFMPAVVYMSSAVGMQTQTLFIRASAIKQVSFLRYIVRELAVDAVLAILLAAVMGFFSWWWTGIWNIAFTVALAMAFTIVLAGAVALVIPFLLMKLKRDPAFGAGPFGTVIQDILSLVVYFAVASLLL